MGKTKRLYCEVDVFTYEVDGPLSSVIVLLFGAVIGDGSLIKTEYKFYW